MSPTDHILRALSDPENLATGIAIKTTWTGFCTSVVGLLSQVNWIGLLGVLFAFSGLLLQLYLGIRKDRREAQLLDAQLRELAARQELRDHIEESTP